MQASACHRGQYGNDANKIRHIVLSHCNHYINVNPSALYLRVHVLHTTQVSCEPLSDEYAETHLRTRAFTHLRDE